MDDQDKYIEALEQEVKEKTNKATELQGHVSASAFASQQDNNLIVWQLELDNILERIEHLLKGDIITEDGEGNVTYSVPKDKNLIVMNNYGVQLIMNTISFYLNRNTILSNYRLERIYEILYDLGNELADLVFINYEKMGLDTSEKRSRSPVLVLHILHMIESAYSRAISGQERESLRSNRLVTQSESLGQPNPQMQNPRRGFTMNPLKRLRGNY